ncbi:hypothetical protein AB1Y20_008034 [Prymnesium parvum]|uniref:Uncharacterized protein n=1 Tax=Prymnesium parvum TaxID=97485 RepID=A0AB34IVZ4_PRYPA
MEAVATRLTEPLAERLKAVESARSSAGPKTDYGRRAAPNAAGTGAASGKYVHSERKADSKPVPTKAEGKKPARPIATPAGGDMDEGATGSAAKRAAESLEASMRNDGDGLLDTRVKAVSALQADYRTASYENDIATIGFDDADLERFHTKELQGLFEMEKLVVAKEGATGGRVSSEETHLRATGVCCMKHGEKQYPVGVFLQDMLCLDKLCSQPIYHSHIIAPQALEEALADIKGTRTTRGKSADNSKSELSGYKTFKHGAYATYHDTEDGVNRTYEEVVLGVMCFQFRDALRLGHIVNQKLLGRPAAEAIGIGASLVTWG